MKPNAANMDDRSFGLKTFDKVAWLARQAGMLNNRHVQRSLATIARCSTDRKTVLAAAGAVAKMLKLEPDFLARQGDQNPFQPYPSRTVHGPLHLGYAHNPFSAHPVPFGLFPHEVNQNMLLCGRAGAGKTVLLLTLLMALIHQGVPLVVADFKRDFRHIIRKGVPLLVLNSGNFKFNPWAPPPGVDPISWYQIVADLFCEAFFSEPPSAAKSALLDILVRLHQLVQERFGGDVYPTFHDVAAALQNPQELSRDFPRNYRDRLAPILNRLRPLLHILREMLDCQAGFAMEGLLEQNVVLELDSLTVEIQTFLVSVLFQWVFSYRMANAQRGQLRHALIFDEAKMVFSKKKASGASAISRLLSMAREFGEPVIAADQMPSTLGHAVLANVYTIIALSLSATKDIREIAYAMGLSAEQREQINRLPVGTGIVKLADRYTRPFLVHFPDFPLRKDVTDEELARYMAPRLAELKWTPRIQFECGSASRESSKSDSPDPPPVPASPEQPKVEKPNPKNVWPFDLAEKEFTYFMDVKNHPFVSLTDRHRALRLTNYMGNKICRRLLELEIVTEVPIREGRRGRTRKFLELTKKARAEIGPQQFGPGKGGFEHVFHQQRLQRLFTEQGFTAQIEAFRNGKAADLGLEREGETIAVEIAMSPPGEISNIHKDLEAGWGRVCVLCRNEGVLKRVQEEWDAAKTTDNSDLVALYLIPDAPIIFNA